MNVWIKALLILVVVIVAAKVSAYAATGTTIEKNSRFCFGMPSQICLRRTSDMLETFIRNAKGELIK